MARRALAHAGRGQAHDRFLRRLGAGQHPGLPTLAHDQHPVGQQQQFRHFRRHDHNGQSLGRQAEYELIDFLFRSDVNAARRLVEKQHAGTRSPATCR